MTHYGGWGGGGGSIHGRDSGCYPTRRIARNGNVLKLLNEKTFPIQEMLIVINVIMNMFSLFLWQSSYPRKRETIPLCTVYVTSISCYQLVENIWHQVIEKVFLNHHWQSINNFNIITIALISLTLVANTIAAIPVGKKQKRVTRIAATK